MIPSWVSVGVVARTRMYERYVAACALKMVRITQKPLTCHQEMIGSQSHKNYALAMMLWCVTNGMVGENKTDRWHLHSRVRWKIQRATRRQACARNAGGTRAPPNVEDVAERALARPTQEGGIGDKIEQKCVGSTTIARLRTKNQNKPHRSRYERNPQEADKDPTGDSAEEKTTPREWVGCGDKYVETSEGRSAKSNLR